MVPRRGKDQRTVWARVREALVDAGLPATQGHVAKMLGIKQPSVSEWNTATGCPKIEHARHLARDLGVCLDWLMNGVEPKRIRPDDPAAQRLWDLWPHLTPFTKGRIVQIAEDNGGHDRPSFPRADDPGTHGRGRVPPARDNNAA